MPTIGIDLGTTNSCVAAFKNGRVEIIANDRGNRVTPSYVSFNEDERLVGEAAKDDASTNYESTFYQIKRLIGRKFDDPVVQADMKQWGFSVINDNNKPKIPVVHSGQRKVFCPEQISAMVLEEMRETAEAFLGETVTDAVITVPAYFNDAQRKATRDAGEIAGLNVIGMINEPTAAAVAYGLDGESAQQRNVLIFDLGGGTFDVTVVTITGRKFDVKATGGDTHLGGEDFDNNTVQHFVEEINREHSRDISTDKRAMSRLRVACEDAKRKLSSATKTRVQVDALFNGRDFRSNISRAKFEDLNYDYFKKTLETVENTLSDAGLDKKDINEVVLVGGSTRIPKIREMLEKYFDYTELRRTINPDEAVAYGAAAYANCLAMDGEDILEKFILEDVTPLSIGVENSGKVMSIVIPRNTKIPTTAWNNRVTLRENQETMDLKIFEGERALTKDNNFLGIFTITGIPPAPRRQGKVEMCFKIDACGVLYVSAVEKITGNSNNITIARDKGRLSRREIDQMVREAEEFKRKDEEIKRRSKAMNALEDMAYDIKAKMKENEIRESLSLQQIENILNRATETIYWLDLNKRKVVELAEVEHRKENLYRICPLFLKKQI